MQTWKEELNNLQITLDSNLSEINKMCLPSISILNKNQQSKENGIIVFELMVKSICDFIGLEFNQNQRRELAVILFDNYHYWNLAEMKLFSLRMKTNYYKDLFGWSKLTPSHLIEVAAEFNSDILKERANYHANKKTESVENVEYVPKERVIQALKDLVISMTEKEKKTSEQVDAENERRKKIIENKRKQWEGKL